METDDWGWQSSFGEARRRASHRFGLGHAAIYELTELTLSGSELLQNQLIAKQLCRRGRDGGLLGDLRGPLGTISKHPEPLAVDARGGHAKHPCCLSDGQPRDLLKVALADPLPLPSELLTLPTCAGETGVDAFRIRSRSNSANDPMMPSSSLPVGLAVSMFSPVLTNDTPDGAVAGIRLFPEPAHGGSPPAQLRQVGLHALRPRH